MELISTHRYRLALGMLLMLINRVAGLVLPATSKYLIDEVHAHKNIELLSTLALSVGCATIVQAVTTFSIAQLLGIAAQRVINDFRVKVHAHVLRLPVSYFDNTQTGALITRVMNDAEGIRNLIGTGIVELAGGMVTSVIALCVLFYMNWTLTTILLSFLLVFGGLLSFAFIRLRPIFKNRRKIEAEVSGRLGETLSGIRIVKAYVAEEREQRIFAENVHRLFINIKKTMTGVSGLTAITTVLIGGIGMLVILGGGRAIIDGSMSVGDLVLYIFLTGMVASPVIQIASIGTQISEAFAGLDRIREILSIPTEDFGDEQRSSCPSLLGDVSFENVFFEYETGKPVLKGISFKARAGTTTALVGSSGSGKSTLVGLLMAFRHPLSGKVLIDGRDLATLKMREYRSQLGIVLQETFLFDGTIEENLAFGRPGASRDEIRSVCELTHCSEFIERFEKGYETIVGERGVKLSGGQRQRVAIARALLAKPRILILDEATSSLDSESEALIQDGLRALRSGRTTFVIAHRLSTIRSAHQILVVEGGEIVERGTHGQLLATGGRYKLLYDRQYAFETERFINPGEEL